jgi:hypothetical protein
LTTVISSGTVDGLGSTFHPDVRSFPGESAGGDFSLKGGRPGYYSWYPIATRMNVSGDQVTLGFKVLC